MRLTETVTIVWVQGRDRLTYSKRREIKQVQMLDWTDLMTLVGDRSNVS